MSEQPQQPQQPVVVNVNITLGDLFEALLRRKRKAQEKSDDETPWVKIDGPQPHPG